MMLSRFSLGAERAADRADFPQDGIESQFQVNHLSHWLFVQGLLPLLEKTAEVRLATSRHGRAEADLSTLTGNRTYLTSGQPLLFRP